MYRFIATLAVVLAITPFAAAQSGVPPKVPDYARQIEKLPTPWVPPVPLVKPSDYARTQQSQYMLRLLLLYSGFYGPSWGNANTYAGSTSGNSSNSYGSSQPQTNTQNPYGQNSAKENTYKPEARKEPLASAAYPNHEPLLGGLADLKLSEVKAQRGDLINARAWMKPKELTTLIQSIDENPMLYRNAERLTQQLQAAGVLRAGDRAIGYTDGKVYVLAAGMR